MDNIIQVEANALDKDASKTLSKANTTTPLFLSAPRAIGLIAYNLAIATLTGAALIYLVTQTIGSALLTTLITVMAAGMLGGAVCNLRGIFTHTQNKGGSLPTRLETPYYIRPPTSAMTGLLTFFLGHLLVTSLSVDASKEGWADLPGRLPYIAIALLAGFAAQEFMERLKALARTLFGENFRNDYYDELEKLSALHEDGLLSDEEFRELKNKELQKLNANDSSSPRANLDDDVKRVVPNTIKKDQ
jgi:hypothetical protein